MPPKHGVMAGMPFQMWATQQKLLERPPNEGAVSHDYRANGFTVTPSFDITKGQVNAANWPTIPVIPDVTYAPILEMPFGDDGNNDLDEQRLTLVNLDFLVPVVSETRGPYAKSKSVMEAVKLALGDELVDAGVSVWGIAFNCTLAAARDTMPTPYRLTILTSDKTVETAGAVDEQGKPAMQQEDGVDMFVMGSRPIASWNAMPGPTDQPWAYLYDRIIDNNTEAVHEFEVPKCYFKIGGPEECDVTISITEPGQGFQAQNQPFLDTDLPFPHIINPVDGQTAIAADADGAGGRPGIIGRVGVRRFYRIGIQLLVSYQLVAAQKYAIEYDGPENMWYVDLSKKTPASYAESLTQQAGLYWPIDWKFRIRNKLSLAAFSDCSALLQQGLQNQFFNRPDQEGHEIGGRKAEWNQYAKTIAGGDPALAIATAKGYKGRRGLIRLGRTTGIAANTKKQEKAPAKKH